MVDAANPLRRDTGYLDGMRTVSAGGAGAAFSFPVVAADKPGLERYGELCRRAVFSPSQSPLWIRSWISAAKPDCLLAFVEEERKPVFALGLAIAKEGPFRIARVMAGTHANGNFFPATADFVDKASPAVFASLFAAIRKARPDIDMLALERQARTIGMSANPLLRLPNSESLNIALAVDLDGGFDALLSRASGKRKCKKHRSQIRKFEAAGGYRRFRARTAAEIDVLLSAFFEMKARRFAEMGIKDVFAAPEIRSFFRSLFTEAQKEEAPPFFLQGLEIGGKPRAVTGMSIAGDRLVCEFGGISEDELTAASPGDFLFFENIREACMDGFRVFDFSVGDEYYKRLWCDIETTQFDVLAPLTLKGHAASTAWRAASHAKRLVKNSDLAWQWARRVRSALVTRSEP
jgi:CelD/BcsL family acetyltransferase involved in cellulose biosynthesis